MTFDKSISINNSTINDNDDVKIKKFQCPYTDCNEFFSKNIRLQTHIRIRHTGYKPYKCTYDNCQSSFACQTYLNKHLKRHEKNESGNEKNGTKKRQWKCEYCCNESTEILLFNNKLQLKKHLSLKHNIKSFICNICSKEFFQKSRLNSHKKRHRGYYCSYNEQNQNQNDSSNEKCKFYTDKWTELRKHLCNEHKKLIKCNQCMNVFSSIYYLRLHEKSKHHNINNDNQDQRKFSCPHENCNRSYLRLTSLQTHLRINHNNSDNQRKFSCNQCNNQYLHRKSLKQHIERFHNNDGNNNDNKQNDSIKNNKKINKKNNKIITKGKLNKLLRIKPLLSDDELIENNNDNDGDIVENNDDVDLETLSKSNLITNL